MSRYVESVANIQTWQNCHVILLIKILMNVRKASQNALRYALTWLEATVANVIQDMPLMPLASPVTLVVCWLNHYTLHVLLVDKNYNYTMIRQLTVIMLVTWEHVPELKEYTTVSAHWDKYVLEIVVLIIHYTFKMEHNRVKVCKTSHAI